MDEEFLGVIPVFRGGLTSVYELLYFTPDGMIVARTRSSQGVPTGALFGAVGILTEVAIRGIIESKKKKEPQELSVEQILKAHKRNYMIPNSDITRVELKIRGILRNIVGIKVVTSKKYGKTDWQVLGTWKIDVGKDKVKWKDACIEKCENMLRPIFGDRLSVVK